MEKNQIIQAAAEVARRPETFGQLVARLCYSGSGGPVNQAFMLAALHNFASATAALSAEQVREYLPDNEGISPEQWLGAAREISAEITNWTNNVSSAISKT